MIRKYLQVWIAWHLKFPRNPPGDFIFNRNHASFDKTALGNQSVHFLAFYFPRKLDNFFYSFTLHLSLVTHFFLFVEYYQTKANNRRKNRNANISTFVLPRLLEARTVDTTKGKTTTTNNKRTTRTRKTKVALPRPF